MESKSCMELKTPSTVKFSNKRMKMFDVKTEFVESKRKNMDLQNEYLQLKIKKIKLEIEALESAKSKALEFENY